MLGGLALELCFPALFISTSFISPYEGSGQPPLCPLATSVGQVSAGRTWPQLQSKAFQSTSGSKLSVHKYICFPPVVLHIWLWVWEERTGTTGQEAMTQQMVKCNYNERCWALAWAIPWKVAAKAGEEWEEFMPLLRKASLAMMMAEGAQQQPHTMWIVIQQPPWCGER